MKSSALIKLRKTPFALAIPYRKVLKNRIEAAPNKTAHKNG